MKIGLLFQLTILLAFLFTGCASAPREEPEEAYLLSVNDHPDSERALYAYAAYLFRHERFQESKSFVDWLLKLRPSNELGQELREKLNAKKGLTQDGPVIFPLLSRHKTGPRPPDFKRTPCDPRNPELDSFALIAAASRGETAEAERRIDAGENIDQKTETTGLTPLLCAIESGSFKTAKFLLSRGADVRLSDSLRRSPLSHAVQKNDSELVKDLLARGADPIEFDGRGTAPLNYAIYWYVYGVESKTPDIIEALLAHPKVNINSPCQTNGETPLETAAYSDDESLVARLLKRGADSTKVVLSRTNKKRIRDLIVAANPKTSGTDYPGPHKIELPKLKELPKLPKEYFPTEEP